MREKIAKLGQNIQFVAFWAHLGVGALIVLVSGRYSEVAAIIVILGASVKEFYFDAKYEKDPPQTFWDNLEDFSGWSMGAVVGFVIYHLL